MRKDKKILKLASKLLDEVERQGYDVANPGVLKSLIIFHHINGDLYVERGSRFCVSGTKKYGGKA